MFSAWDFNGWLISVGVMLFMLWVYFSAAILLYGAEIASELKHLCVCGTYPRIKRAVAGL